VNTRAQRFFEKHGFKPARRGINPINGQPNIGYQRKP